MFIIASWWSGLSLIQTRSPESVKYAKLSTDMAVVETLILSLTKGL